MFRIFRLIAAFLVVSVLLATGKDSALEGDKQNVAIVSLVMPNFGDFWKGAIALGQSLVEVNSSIPRVLMVTGDIENYIRYILLQLWDDIIEVDPIDCIYKTSAIASSKYDMSGEHWSKSMNNWRPTCTKLQVFSLTQFEKVVFMDSDMIVLQSFDHLLIEPFIHNSLDASLLGSNSLFSLKAEFMEYEHVRFAAAAEVLPPDSINSGFMLLTPNTTIYNRLLELNTQKSLACAWTGDQYLINYGLCSHWHGNIVRLEDSNKMLPIRERYPDTLGLDCHRLPWKYNVQINEYKDYVGKIKQDEGRYQQLHRLLMNNTLNAELSAATRKLMNGLSTVSTHGPVVLHYISTGKPWKLLPVEMQYVNSILKEIATDVDIPLSFFLQQPAYQSIRNQILAHIIEFHSGEGVHEPHAYWRYVYYKGLKSIMNKTDAELEMKLTHTLKKSKPKKRVQHTQSKSKSKSKSKTKKEKWVKSGKKSKKTEKYNKFKYVKDVVNILIANYSSEIAFCQWTSLPLPKY